MVLVNKNNLPRMLRRKEGTVNVIRGVDKYIRGAEIKLRQRNSDKMLTLKRPLKYLVPFEIMDTENNGVLVDIPPLEICNTPEMNKENCCNERKSIT